LARDSWYRILVKLVDKNDMSKYKWCEMTFLTRWDEDHNTVFCIGTDSFFEGLLQECLGRTGRELAPANPWSMQVPLLEAIVALQDRSVWLVRDVVRNVEKVYSIGVLRELLTDARTDCDLRVNMMISYVCTKPPGIPRIALKPLVCLSTQSVRFGRKFWKHLPFKTSRTRVPKEEPSGFTST
jgi:hypothetical protein